MNEQKTGRARLIEMVNDPAMVQQAWCASRQVGEGPASFVTLLLWESGFLGIPYYTFPRYLAAHLKKSGWKPYLPGEAEPQAGDLFFAETHTPSFDQIGVVAKRGISRGEESWFKAMDDYACQGSYEAYRRGASGVPSGVGIWNVYPVSFFLRFG